MGMFELIKLLSENRIDYVLVGGLAAGLRPTAPVDIDELEKLRAQKSRGAA